VCAQPELSVALYRCIVSAHTRGQCCPVPDDPMCGINLNARRPGKPSQIRRRGAGYTVHRTQNTPQPTPPPSGGLQPAQGRKLALTSPYLYVHTYLPGYTAPSQFRGPQAVPRLPTWHPSASPCLAPAFPLPCAPLSCPSPVHPVPFLLVLPSQATFWYPVLCSGQEAPRGTHATCRSAPSPPCQRDTVMG
jgi:hypothetical protein